MTRRSSSPARSTGTSRRPARASLSAADCEAYAAQLRRLVAGGRLNKQYPDPFACEDYLVALAEGVRLGAYPPFSLADSGLPELKHMVQVQVDAELAEGFVRDAEGRLEAGRTLTEKAAAKLAHYRKVRTLDLPPLHRLSVRLRRVEGPRAGFVVVQDRYDIAESCFARTTILLEQEDRRWEEAFLRRSGDYSKPTREFRLRIESLTRGESEITFLLLGSVPGVTVEEIVHGRIGPLWSDWRRPAGWPKGGAVLHLPLDRASVHLSEDRDDDPFATLYRRFLSEGSRFMVEEQAENLGYRVHKDRKFVCTPEAEPHLRERLKKAGTQNIVYAA